MDILETITSHTAALRLPLYAVSLSATQKADTPIMLILHWHGFHRNEAAAGALRSVAGSAMQINQRWDDYAVIDRAMLEAAWRLGAWDVERVARPAWWRLNAPVSEALACRRAFADYSDVRQAGEAVVVEAPDQQALLELAPGGAMCGGCSGLARAGCGAKQRATTAPWMPTAGAPRPVPSRCNPRDGNCGARSCTAWGAEEIF